MTGVLVPPRARVVTEDIRNLQGRPSHARGSDRWLDIQIFQWAFHLLQAFGRYLAVAGRILNFLVAQQHLDDTDILVLLEQVCGKGMAPMSLTT